MDVVYDGSGRPVSVTQGDRRLVYTYDAAGNVASITDALGDSASFAYDGMDRLTQITGPDGGVTAFTYDAHGNLATLTPPAVSGGGSLAGRCSVIRSQRPAMPRP